MQLLIPVGEGSAVQLYGHGLCLPCPKAHLLESSELMNGSRHSSLGSCHIQLHHFLAGHPSYVSHIHRHRQRISCLYLSLGELQVRVSVRRIGQSVSEGEEHIHSLRIIISVSYEHAFRIYYLVPVAGEIQIRRIILQLHRERLREPSARICFSEEEIVGRAAHVLSAEIHLEYPLHLICPRHLHRRAVVQHHYHVRLHLEHLFYKYVLILGQPHMGPVISFRLEDIRQSGEYHSHITLLRCVHRFGDESPVRLFPVQSISVRIYEIMALSLRRIHEGCHLEGIDMRASATLISGRLREPAYDSYGVIAVKRQDPVVL